MIEKKCHRNIALLTDFGHRDAYAAQLKGAILSINPHASVIDLSHDIDPFNIQQAAYLVEQSSRFLPPSTIIVAVVDPGVGSERQPIALLTRRGKYYIGPDNGLFTHIVTHEKLRVAHLLHNRSFFLPHEVSNTFHGRDIFGPVAAHVSLGQSLDAFGPRLTKLVSLPLSRPKLEDDAVYGEIVHIDHYGNIVTNITFDYLTNLELHETVGITLGGRSYRMTYCSTYADVALGKLLCLMNSNKAFEVARFLDSAALLLGAKIGERITVFF